MSENDGSDTTPSVPESPKPMAFTINFGGGKNVDSQRHKALVEKYQNRHRRGQSLSKLDDCAPSSTTSKKHPLSGKLPRKSSFHSDEPKSRANLTLPLKNTAGDKMTQSFPGLSTVVSPEFELKDVSSPELVVASPFTPMNGDGFVSGTDFDFDKSDAASDAGTYTLDAENYTEEQKARMSIDREFNIEEVSVMKKTEEYVRSLINNCHKPLPTKQLVSKSRLKAKLPQSPDLTSAPQSPILPTQNIKNLKLLSPILSPTQNMSIESPTQMPTSKETDYGCFTSVTSSGAFSRKGEFKEKRHARRPSLTKSEIQIQTYTEDAQSGSGILMRRSDKEVHEIENLIQAVKNLPPSGKNSPSKIPSPIHSLSHPRSHSSVSSLNIDLSDSSLETESFLKPTQNYINSLQKRLSLDSDSDSKCNIRLNNEAAAQHIVKQKMMHVRHNSFDDRNLKISNKLEHFQSKNLQGIDQTYTNKLNQYQMHKTVHKIQNSPNNSPIRRSSSFSSKQQNQPKLSNLSKDSNIRNSPNPIRNGSIQRSTSTANIKPQTVQLPVRQPIDRNRFGDTESSSEEDFEKNLLKKKDLSNLTSTRYNRAFSLRRGRLDEPKCPNTPEMRRKFQPTTERAISVDRRPVKTNDVQSRYLQSVSKARPMQVEKEPPKCTPKSGIAVKGVPNKTAFSRTDSGRVSVRANKPPSTAQPTSKKGGLGKDILFVLHLNTLAECSVRNHLYICFKYMVFWKTLICRM